MKQQAKRARVEPNFWEIDPNTPITDLKQQAFDEVKRGARENGYRLLDRPVFTILHGERPRLRLDILAVKR